MASSGGTQQPTLTVYPVTSYTFGQKAPVVEKDPTVIHRLERMKEKCVLQLSFFHAMMAVLQCAAAVREIHKPRSAHARADLLPKEPGDQWMPCCWCISTTTCTFCSSKWAPPSSSSRAAVCAWEKTVRQVHACMRRTVGRMDREGWRGRAALCARATRAGFYASPSLAAQRSPGFGES